MVSPGRESQLITAFLELAETAVKDFDLADLLHNLVGHCVDLLHLESAGLMLSDSHGNLQVIASSSERSRLLELLQLETNTGPCLDCFRSGVEVSAADLAEVPDRWPLFVERARRDGYAAAYALPIRTRDQMLGVLNLFSAVPGDLASADLQLGQALAHVATIGVLQDLSVPEPTSLTAHMDGIWNGRIVIEQAKGLVAEAGSLDMDEAFARLRTFARSNHKRLADTARQLVDGTVSAATLLQNKPSAAAKPARRRTAQSRAPSPSRESTRTSAGSGGKPPDQALAGKVVTNQTDRLP